MPRLLCPSWRWITISGTPSRAISTAWTWRSWCGAKRRRTPAAAATRRSCARAAAEDQLAPAGRAGDDAQQRADRQLPSQFEQRLQLFPRPTVHADFASATVLAAPHQQRAACLIEIAFGELERSSLSSIPTATGVGMHRAYPLLT